MASKDFSKFRLRGTIAAPFTPFRPNGDVNFDVLEEYMDQLVAREVDCVFVNGTTGEGLSTTVAERKATAEKWITLGKSRFQAVIIHVGAANLRDIQDLARHAEAHGADAISTIPPIFFKPSDMEEMINFLAEVASAAPNTPFFYYHNPSMVGPSSFSLECLIKEIFSAKRIPTLCGVKYTSPDLYDYGRCHASVANLCQFMYGVDEQLLPALTLGGEAFIGSTYNYLGKVTSRLFKAFQANDIAGARTEQFKNQALVSVLKRHGGHIGINKAIMCMAGPDVGPARPPLHNPTAEEKAQLRKDLEAIKFFEWI